MKKLMKIRLVYDNFERYVVDLEMTNILDKMIGLFDDFEVLGELEYLG